MRHLYCCSCRLQGSVPNRCEGTGGWIISELAHTLKSIVRHTGAIAFAKCKSIPVVYILNKPLNWKHEGRRSTVYGRGSRVEGSQRRRLSATTSGASSCTQCPPSMSSTVTPSRSRVSVCARSTARAGPLTRSFLPCGTSRGPPKPYGALSTSLSGRCGGSFWPEPMTLAAPGLAAPCEMANSSLAHAFSGRSA